MSSPAAESERPRIAVLAVHGVGDQVPAESARSIARMLASLEDGGRIRYAPVAERSVHLPVRPMWERRDEAARAAPAPVRRAPPPGRLARVLRAVGDYATSFGTMVITPVQAIRGARRRAGYTDPASDLSPDEIDDLSLQLMDEQLRHYAGGLPSGTLQTVRLETTRRDDAHGGPAADVDIHEMYWADLSRPGNTFVRIASELYQLFLHLANLGALLLDNQAARSGGAWQVLADRHGVAVGLVTTLIPLLNVFAAATLLLLPVLRVDAVALGWIVTAGLALAAAALAEAWFGRRRPGSSMRSLGRQVAVGTAAGLATAVAVHLVVFHSRLAMVQYALAAALWLVVAFRVGAKVTAAWDRHQPGVSEVARAITVAWTITALVVVAMAWAGAHPQGARGVIAIATMRVGELAIAATSVAWVWLLALAAYLWASGRRLGRAAGHFSNGERTVVTARATLALTSVAVLVITLLGWHGLSAMASPLLPGDISYDGLLTPHPGARVLAAEVSALLVRGMSTGLVPMLLVVMAAVAIVLWTFLPVVWGEVRPPRPKADPRDEVASDLIGTRLTLAYRAARVAGFLLSVALVVLLAGIVVDWVGAWLPGDVLRVTTPFARANERLTLWLAGALGVSAVGLFLFRGRLNAVTLGLRPVLDIALDVDNYLRLHPVEATPRARIAERYASLLAHLFSSGRGPRNARPYDALVVVAHSQGTVITADLFRYVRNRNLLAGNLGYDVDPAAMTWRPPMPVYLFTMGCPLRQLYQLRFPALYDWMGSPQGRDRESLPEAAQPLLDQVGVAAWVNVYRSGDYVGRQLWLDEQQCQAVYRRVRAVDDATPPTAIHFAVDDTRRRREACLGAGGHTHYWDDTAPEVAAVLDEMIAQAARDCLPAGGDRPAIPSWRAAFATGDGSLAPAAPSLHSPG